MATVVLDAVSKRLGGTLVVEDVSLEVADGEFMVLLVTRRELGGS